MSTQKAVEKALNILLGFVPDNQPMGTVEISDRLGHHKSTVSRLLHVLTEKGFLHQDENTRKFELGMSAVRLGKAVRLSIERNLVSIAGPVMEAVRNDIAETVALVFRFGDFTVQSHFVEGPHRANFAGKVGDILSMHAGAGGKVILAFSPPDVVGRFLGRPLEALTPNTITDPDVLIKELDTVRRLGVAFDDQEHDVGTAAIAAPVFDNSAVPVAALVAVGLAQRMDLRWNAPAALRVKEGAFQISKRLMFDPDPM